MIELRRGRLLRIGHRGAAALAPANTIEAFERALALGCDLVEFDVVRAHGALVVAHSTREVAAQTPTLEETLAFFAARPEAGLHVDLKLAEAGEVVGALERYELAGRAVVTSVHAGALRAVAGRVAVGLTYPADRSGLGQRRAAQPFARAAAAAMRRALPARVGRLLARSGASALMLHALVVSAAAVERAHGLGAAVVAWTVNDPATLQRVVAAGVDGVVGDDPRLFREAGGATLPP